MVGVRRCTAWTQGRGHSGSARDQVHARDVACRTLRQDAGDGRGSRVLLPPMAFTTLPKKLGCRSPKKLTKRPSPPPGPRTMHQHVCGVQQEQARSPGWTGAPSSSIARKYLPSSLMRPSSRASTVLGCVPRLHGIARPAVSFPVPSARVRRSAAAWPQARRGSTARGVELLPAKRTPSSRAFATSSWFSV